MVTLHSLSKVLPLLPTYFSKVLFMTQPVALEPIASESLYELVTNFEPSPAPLQVGPASFKSTVAGVIDLLVEQKISAMVWAKLPRGETWQAELERYGGVVGLPQAVYNFSNHREEIGGSEEAVPLREMAADRTVPIEQPISLTNVPPLFAISLSPETPLRRDYFLLIWAAQFCGLLVSQRLRLPPSQLDAAAAMDGAILGSPSEAGPEEAPEKKQVLVTLVSFQRATVEPVVDFVKRVLLAEAAPISAWQEPVTFSSSEVITHWEQTFSQNHPPLDQPYLKQLITSQAQRYEDLWQKSSNYRRRAEMVNLLQMQNEELLNAIRLKDEFLNNVGQELRTPLTNMKTALTLLNSPSLKLPQRQRYMELLTKECDRQGSLITSLLDLVRLDQMAEVATIQSLRLSDVVPGVVSTYQPLAEDKGIRLAYTIPEDLPTIACLSTWLKQIVINLLHNGIKFTGRGGQVWVRAKQQGDYVQLEFRDTGIGIAPGEIPKIFDRFYRVRQATGEEISGAGLGLTIVQQLLLHCGGSISVKSRIGEGSTFNVLLPIHRDPLEELD
jgi:two-component system, OmpR family, phosphate regulon sensor histidine kinase PhoR